MLTQQRLFELVDYDPTTGIFRWKVNNGPARVGAVAGHVTKRGYVSMMVDRFRVYGHQLAWLWAHGAPLPVRIDHRNRNRSDNRIDNLRAATNAENLWNAGVKAHNKLGLKGVTRVNDRFRAEIRVNKRRIHIGYFATPEEASAAYAAAASIHHGQFANDGKGCG